MDEPVGLVRSGETLGPLELVVTRERVHAYASASGDYNPIHLDPEFAATTPFGGPIAHGMLLLSYFSRLLSDRFGRAWVETGQLEARFRAPALVGASISVHGIVRSVTTGQDGEQLECVLRCEAAGQLLVTATARLILGRSEGACAKS